MSAKFFLRGLKCDLRCVYIGVVQRFYCVDDDLLKSVFDVHNENFLNLAHKDTKKNLNHDFTRFARLRGFSLANLKNLAKIVVQDNKITTFI